MALGDPENLLSTPAGYATPTQLSAMRDYAAALQRQSMGGDTRHWLQGVSHMVEALMGGHLARQADVAEARQRAAQADILTRNLGGPDAGAPAAPTSAPTPSLRSPREAGGPLAYGAGGVDSLPLSYANQIKDIEGFAPEAKWDVSQHSYGYGSRAPAPGATIDRAGAEDLFSKDMANAAQVVDSVNPNLSPGTRAALISLTHNTGNKWVNSGLGERIRAGDEEGAKEHFAQYTNVAGAPNAAIAQRRQRELGWFGQGRDHGPALAFTGEPTPAMMPPAMPAGVPSPGRPTLPTDEVPRPIGAPALPPDARTMVTALAGAPSAPTAAPAVPAGPALAQATPPSLPAGPPTPRPPQDQVRAMAGALIRTGMDPVTALKTATESVLAHQNFLPTYQRDEHGNLWASMVGQPPQMVQRGPGKLITIDPGIPGVPHRRYIENVEQDPKTGAWRLTHTPFSAPMAASPPNTAGAAPPAAAAGPPPAYVPPLAGAARPPPPEVRAAGIPPLGETPTPRAPAFPATGASAAPRPQMPGPSASDQEWLNYQNDLKVWEAGAKKGAEEGAAKNVEGLFKPINEARDRGGQKAQETLNVLDRMDDAYRQGGPNVSGGPLGDFALKLKQLGNQILGGGEDTWKGLTESEVIRKSTAELALKAIKEASSRGGTQREFIAMLDNNPGINLSNTGSRYMIDILRQQEKQSQAVAQLANRMGPENAHQWQDTLVRFYNDPRNALRSPFTGKPLVGDALKEDAERLRTAKAEEGGWAGPPGALGTRPPGTATPAEIAAAKSELARRARAKEGAPPGGP